MGTGNKRHAAEGYRGNFDMWRRRRYLVAAGGLAALSGCLGGDDDDDGGNGDGEDEVPDIYASATSLGSEQRNPDELTPKADVQFSEYAEATEKEAHVDGTCCANCADYIIDKNGDGIGACAEVAGAVDREDWCTLWEELPEPAVPDGMTEEELATAEVPQPYRTADSQGGEARDPDNLSPQSAVSLGESVEAIADGTTEAGQSCGNCAEYIPDKNGDGWGACAKVEGYIAVEDWCSIWEHVTEAL